MSIAFRLGGIVVLLALAALLVATVVGALSSGCPLESVPAWAWLAALVPASVVVQHALYVHVVRGPQVLDRELPPGALAAIFGRGPSKETPPERRAIEPAVGAAPGPSWTTGGEFELVRSYRPLVETSVAREFAPLGLVIRYGLPAVLILLLVVAWTSSVLAPTSNLLDERMREAAWFGLAGAYAYGLLQLGKRSFQRDITTGVSTWVAVTLALGPLIAILVSRLGFESFASGAAEGGAPAGDGGDGDERGPGGLVLALYFVAGFSPRWVVETLVENVRRRSGYMTSANSVARGVPLTDVRGVVPDVAERLGEEGIADVAGLAYTDPIRVLRNTAFDKRQVLAWIDEALLIVTLPEHWQALEKQGITGAVDLAWYSESSSGPVGPEPAPPAVPAPGFAPPGPDPAGEPPPTGLARLAAAINVEEALLWEVSRRLFEDAQVLIVWTLYQSHTRADAPGG